MRVPLVGAMLSMWFASATLAGDPIAAEGFHKRIDALVIANKLDEAETLALEAYRQHPDVPEVICALGCVYRNKATRSSIAVDTDAMGIKEGESGHVDLTTENRQRFFHDRITYDPELYAKAEERYYECIRKAPGYKNPYFDLLNDYVTLSRFDKYFEVIGLFVSNLKDVPQTRADLLDLAGKLFRNEQVDLQHTLRLYRILVDSFPDFVDAKADYGAALLANGELEKALPVLKAAYDANPSDPTNASNYHFGLILNEDFAAAWPVAQRVPADTPNRPYALALLAVATAHDPAPILAAAAKNAAKRDKDFWSQAGEDLLALSTFTPERRRSVLGEQARQFAANGYDIETILAAHLLQATAPEEGPHASVILGAVFDKRNILSKTVKYLNRIAAAREQDASLMSAADLQYNYGRAYLQAGQPAAALGYLQKSFDLRQDQPRVNHMLGLCHLRLGDKQKARSFFALNAKLSSKNDIGVINSSIRMLRSLDAEAQPHASPPTGP
jgi:tetratricopeptide (TPR) repeat protein